MSELTATVPKGTRYFTTVASDGKEDWLCLIAVEHGQWLFTGHKFANGLTVWNYQGPVARFKEFDISWPEGVKFSDMPLVQPSVDEAAAKHGYTLEILPVEPTPSPIPTPLEEAENE